MRGEKKEEECLSLPTLSPSGRSSNPALLLENFIANKERRLRRTAHAGHQEATGSNPAQLFTSQLSRAYSEFAMQLKSSPDNPPPALDSPLSLVKTYKEERTPRVAVRRTRHFNPKLGALDNSKPRRVKRLNPSGSASLFDAVTGSAEHGTQSPESQIKGMAASIHVPASPSSPSSLAPSTNPSRPRTVSWEDKSSASYLRAFPATSKATSTAERERKQRNRKAVLQARRMMANTRPFIGCEVRSTLQEAVVVAHCDKGQPADIAGIKERDLVLSVDGQSTINRQSFYRVLASLKPHTLSTFVVERKGVLLSVDVRMDSLNMTEHQYQDMERIARGITDTPVYSHDWTAWSDGHYIKHTLRNERRKEGRAGSRQKMWQGRQRRFDERNGISQEERANREAAKQRENEAKQARDIEQELMRLAEERNFPETRLKNYEVNYGFTLKAAHPPPAKIVRALSSIGGSPPKSVQLKDEAVKLFTGINNILNQVSRSGSSEELSASLQQHFSRVPYLTQHGQLDLNQPSSSTKSTLLHTAAWNRHVEAVRLLLQHRADPRKQNLKGNSPLHLAVEIGHKPDGIKCVLLMLEHGGDLAAKNINGKTPPDMTRSESVLSFIKNCRGERVQTSLQRESPQVRPSSELLPPASEGTTTRPMTSLTTSRSTRSDASIAQLGDSVVVSSVDPNSHAAQVGLRKGDFIHAVNGIPTVDSKSFYFACSRRLFVAAGDEITLSIKRAQPTNSLDTTQGSPDAEAISDETGSSNSKPAVFLRELQLKIRVGAVGRPRSTIEELRAQADQVRLRMQELRGMRERKLKRKTIVIPDRLLAPQYKVDGVKYIPGTTVSLPCEDQTPIATPRVQIK